MNRNLSVGMQTYVTDFISIYISFTSFTLATICLRLTFCYLLLFIVSLTSAIYYFAVGITPAM